MKKIKKVSNSSNNDISNSGLTLKDYLESATDASKRTRFITIIMVVISALVLVSVLNSSDLGWISLRLAALRNNASLYTIKKFPLLCKCDQQVKEERRELCKTLEAQEENNDLFWMVNEIDYELETLKDEMPKSKGQQEWWLKKEQDLIDSRKRVCERETNKLDTFSEAMQRSASDTKYTVRTPFFGVAFDVNDIGILGGFSLWIVLMLLRLSLRSQIVSLRIGFKKAFASDQEKDFYEVLAARQVFVFPPLRDHKQQGKVLQGWIEQWWRQSKLRKLFYKDGAKLLQPLYKMRGKVLAYLDIEEISKEDAPADLENNVDEWEANRNIALRIVPKGLSLLPLFIYSVQYINDIITRHYGNELSPPRTWFLLIVGGIFLLNILIFGIWCITKWNELDKLWDYYDEYIRHRRKPGEINLVNKGAV